MTNQELARQILNNVGGPDNVQSRTHCITRLRLIVSDLSLVNEEAIKKLPVMGTNTIGNQFQVIIGPKVTDVYKEFAALTPEEKSTEAPQEKKSLISNLLDTLSGIFIPILPAIIGAGLLKGILIMLMFFNVVSTDSTTYQLLSVFCDAAYYFLPMLLAVSTAEHLKCSKMVAMSLAGIMLHPDLITLFSSGEPVTFVGLPVTAASYQSGVLPIILSVWMMSYVEKGARKIVPDVLKTLFVPLLTLLISAPIALIIIGPAGTIVSDVIATNFLAFYRKFGLLAGALYGGAAPILVLFGIHNGFVPVMVQSLSTYGVDYLMGMNVASNSAQAGATTAIFLKSKNPEFKSLAGTAALNAIIGITEPALYGVTSRLKKPLIAVCAAGAVGGAIAGFFRITATGMGTGPIAGIPLFLTDTFIWFIVSCLISFILAFGMTWMMKFNGVPEMEAPAQSSAESGETNKSSETLKTEKKNTEYLAEPDAHPYSETLVKPAKGSVLPLSQVKDQVFASGMMGPGAALRPESGEICSPVDGTVAMIFPTGHAIGLISNQGNEILIHIGMDTVTLEGKGFEVFAKPGQRVRQGDLLIKADLDYIQKQGLDITTPVVITNSDENLTVTVKEDPNDEIMMEVKR